MPAASRSSCAGGLQPLFRLLLVSNADRPIRHTLLQVRRELLMERDIVLGDCDQTLLEQVIDIVAGNIQRHIFRALPDSRSCSVRARRLPANFGFASARVIQQFVDDQVAFCRVERMIGDPESAPSRVPQAFNTD
jgi:hypothetical protein